MGYDNRYYVDNLLIIKEKELTLQRAYYVPDILYMQSPSVLQVNIIFISKRKKPKLKRLSILIRAKTHDHKIKIVIVYIWHAEKLVSAFYLILDNQINNLICQIADLP